VSPPPDIEKYRSYVDRFDLTEQQKAELVHTVWQVVEGFAYRAFGLDPVQQALGAGHEEGAAPASSMLDFNTTSQLANPPRCALEQHAHDSERKKI
jgi:hypothetical protein